MPRLDQGPRWTSAVRAAVRLAPLVFGLGLVAASALLGDEALKREITLIFVFVVLVVGLYVFIGTTGVLSFGHMSFLMVGAYVTALLTVPPSRKAVLLSDLPDFLQRLEAPPLIAAAAAGVGATLLAVVIGTPLMRLARVAASLATFATLIVVYTIATQWEAVTRGRLTMLGVPRETGLIRALVAAWGAIIVAYFFTESRVGLRLRASRDDETSAKAAGVDVVRDRRVALAVSAFITGVGGFIYGQYLGSFNPNVFFLGITFTTVAMLVAGGKNSLTGAVVGTLVVSLVSILLRHFEGGISIGTLIIAGTAGTLEVGLAALLLGILLLRPAGLTGGQELWRHAWWMRLVGKFGRATRPTLTSTKSLHGVDEADIRSPVAERDKPDTRAVTEGEEGSGPE